MAITTALIVVAASVLVAAFVAWPLLIGRPEATEDAAEGSDFDELLAQKDATYGAIKELQFDHAMGNLSTADYQELAKRYEDKAVALLQTIDEVSRSGILAAAGEAPVAGMVRLPRMHDVGDAIEEEIAAMRAKRRNGGGPKREQADDVEQQVAALRAARHLAKPGPAAGLAPGEQATGLGSCSNCGATIKSTSAAYCRACGASLHARCPGCASPVDAEDAFCSGCGTALTEVHAAGRNILTGGPNG